MSTTVRIPREQLEQMGVPPALIARREDALHRAYWAAKENRWACDYIDMSLDPDADATDIIAFAREREAEAKAVRVELDAIDAEIATLLPATIADNPELGYTL